MSEKKRKSMEEVKATRNSYEDDWKGAMVYVLKSTDVYEGLKESPGYCSKCGEKKSTVIWTKSGKAYCDECDPNTPEYSAAEMQINQELSVEIAIRTVRFLVMGIDVGHAFYLSHHLEECGTDILERYEEQFGSERFGSGDVLLRAELAEREYEEQEREAKEA